MIAASRPVLLAAREYNSSRVYAEDDVRIHCQLILRTKLVISGLLESISVEKQLSGDVLAFSAYTGTNLSSQTISLAILAIEAVKSHLIWTSSKNILVDNAQHLSMQCSQSMAKWMLHALSPNSIWNHILAYLVDLLPHLPHHMDPCLPRVVLRILHAYLLRHNKAVTLFQQRCLARGYFIFLFQLVVDSSESVANVAISIVGYILEMSLDGGEITCFAGLDFSTGSSNNDEMQVDHPAMHSAQRENKRRRILEGDNHSSNDVQGASIDSTLVHFVMDSITKADRLVNSMEVQIQNQQSSKGIPPITNDDMPNLRAVCGTLRILLSLHAIPSSTPSEEMRKALDRVFSCIQKVSMALASQAEICRIEPKVLRQSVALIASVGYHAYHVGNRTGQSQSKYHAERESIAHCVMATLPLIDSDDFVEFDDETELDLPSNSGVDGHCNNFCSRLCSLIGVKSNQPGICLCGLGREDRNCRLWRECGEFVLSDVLPLKSR
jgi:hypothetical protein